MQPLPTNKGVTLARTRLAGMLGVPLYDLDRLDLRANTTLQHELQESVTAYLQKLADPDYAAQLGLIGERLLTPTSTRSVRYSFTLFERTPSGNQVRVQTDNTDQPFDINEGSKLELGSTAKLRVLASYLETVAQIHRDYGGMSVAELRKVEVEPLDFILRWGIDHLVASRDRDLSAMLQAAMERRYSASPYESFFTGGGLHTFNNFRKEDNGRRPMLLEALRESINLPFVRLLRDLIRHDIYQNAGSKVQCWPTTRTRAAPTTSTVSSTRKARSTCAASGSSTATRTPTSAWRPSSTACVPGRCGWLRSIATCSHRPTWRASAPSSANACPRQPDRQARRRAVRALRPGQVQPQRPGLRRPRAPAGAMAARLSAEAAAGDLRRGGGGQRRRAQEVYGWLFKSRHKNARDKRIRILLEVEAFLDLHQQWKKLGYPSITWCRPTPPPWAAPATARRRWPN